MKKIIFIDTRDKTNSAFHLDRQDFYTSLNNEFSISVLENLSSADKADIVFIHQGFYSDSNLLISSSERNPIVKNSLFVFYGNNTQEPISIDKNEVSYFNFYVLKQNFKAFIEELSKNELKESSWNILLGFEPRLEELLESFESVSPYETTSKQGKILKDAKAELQIYVEEYLQKQSKV